MKVDDFDYPLPATRIAQRPLSRRDASRLAVLDRRTGAVEHERFRDLPGLLRPGDLLVFNDTRVIPARLRARKPTGGAVEILLVERLGPEGGGVVWRALLGASRTPAEGSELVLDEGLRARVLRRDGELYAVRLRAVGADTDAVVDRVGEMPLPPYIRRSPHDPASAEDRTRYQTIFARRRGAVAAPTAGLHFTDELLEALDRRGIATTFVTLHVGIGTFLPVRTERVERHRMHAERFTVSRAAASRVRETRERGGRVVAVGTTVVRTLETVADGAGRVRCGRGASDLFIHPGHEFRVVDALLTNFHLPRSTLLMLVCAFAGRKAVLGAYREAVDRGYRFYSYGDAMLVK